MVMAFVISVKRAAVVLQSAVHAPCARLANFNMAAAAADFAALLEGTATAGFGVTGIVMRKAHALPDNFNVPEQFIKNALQHANGKT